MICDERFSRVREAFEATFHDPRALGAAVAVIVDGKVVVDLWGGFADGRRTRAWQRETVMNVWSVTKGFTSMCVHRLIATGQLDVDAPVARYWPEFASAGKEAITVRALLNHRAGLPGIRAMLPSEALFDWTTMTDALAAEEPWWPPDTQHGYHATTFGWLVGEVIRRITNKTVARYFREEIARDANAYIGLPAELDDRAAELRQSPHPGTPTLFDRIMAAPESMVARAFANPLASVPNVTATREWRAAELPAMNGHADARSIAQLYDRAMDLNIVEGSNGMDAVLEVPTRFGLGFMMSQGDFSPSARAFGHPGMGGSLGFADPDARVAFGFIANRMGSSILLDSRATALIRVVYASL
jgi:CubicO group peptidase (beta-lactamase class C family)